MKNSHKGKKLLHIWLSEEEVKVLSNLLNRYMLDKEALSQIGTIIATAKIRGDFLQNERFK